MSIFHEYLLLCLYVKLYNLKKLITFHRTNLWTIKVWHFPTARLYNRRHIFKIKVIIFAKLNCNLNFNCHYSWVCLTLSYPGGGRGAKRPRFWRLVVTPRRLYLLYWNFLTFPKHKKTKFWANYELKFFTPTPLRRGY